jgi:hypothetical protein
MAAPPVSPQPGAAPAEQAGDERPNLAAAAPAAPISAPAANAASKSQAIGAWVFGAILLGLLVVFLYFPPKGGTVTGFCIEAVITAIFAGLFGYFILGATNQNWNWKITENLSVSIQATGGFALTIGTAALFLGVYYWSGQRAHLATANSNAPTAANASTKTPSNLPPAPAPGAVATPSNANALSAKVVSTTSGKNGVVELGIGEQAFEKLGYQPGDTIDVTIAEQQYILHYVQNRADAAKGEDYLFINVRKRVAIATGGKSFAVQHGVEVGAEVEIPKKQ